MNSMVRICITTIARFAKSRERFKQSFTITLTDNSHHVCQRMREVKEKVLTKLGHLTSRKNRCTAYGSQSERETRRMRSLRPSGCGSKLINCSTFGESIILLQDTTSFSRSLNWKRLGIKTWY